jgi:hypothetical protein
LGIGEKKLYSFGHYNLRDNKERGSKTGCKSRHTS